MKFARDKRLLLCGLALWAPLPLPLNEPRPEGVVGWPFLLIYLLAVSLCMRRAWKGEERWLGTLSLNLLGLAYIPFLIFDLARLDGGNLVRPSMHLVLFALVAKLFSIERERDKWHALIGVFFVFVSSMATSASPGIVVYLVVFLGLATWVLSRFSRLHLGSLESQLEGAAKSDPSGSGTAEPSGRRAVAGLIAVTVLLSGPFFLLLPRMGTPYLTSGGGGRALGFATGFTDEVNLDITGLVRGNRTVALRLELDGPEPAELRFRGAAFDHYQTDRWSRGRSEWSLLPRAERQFPLATGRRVGEARIFLEPLRVRSLILPVETLGVEFDRPQRFLRRTRAGAIRLPGPPSETLSYRVDLARSAVALAAPPDPEKDGSLDQDGISTEIADLATLVAADGTRFEQARRIERHLVAEYEYTLDFIGRPPGQPIDDFLFKYRSGHCEYFASAMVLMLRSVGIPARFVTGFLGGERNPLGYYIVRQGNAHAWVEAFIPDRGWTIFDPTPPAGRPVIEPRSVWSLVRQTYDFMIFGWDRYVVSYGVNDQAELLGRLREWLRSLFDSGAEPVAPDTVVAETQAPLTSSAASPWRAVWLAAFLPLFVLFWLWWQRPDRSATGAYVRLRRQAATAGLLANSSTPPLLFERRLGRRFPEAREPVARVIDLYLRESYGGEELSEAERREAAGQVDRVGQLFRRTG